MPLEHILQEILQKIPDSNHIHGTNCPEATSDTLNLGALAIVQVLEKEFNARYQDPGSGLHFEELLLAVFVADVVSTYLERSPLVGEGVGWIEDRKLPTMVSCLYSKETIRLILCQPADNQSKLKDNLAQLQAATRENDNASQYSTVSRANEIQSVYYASAAVPLISAKQFTPQRQIPFFGCPREFSAESNGISTYVHERFEETDLLAAFMLATQAKTLEDALDVIFGSHPPVDTSAVADCGGVFHEYEFYSLQFSRGYGGLINWLNDSTLLNTIRLELDQYPSFSSPKIIRIFGSMFKPKVLLEQSGNIGVYLAWSKEYLFLSQSTDFFEAGLEFSKRDTAIAISPNRNEEFTTPTLHSIVDDTVPAEPLNSAPTAPSNPLSSNQTPTMQTLQRRPGSPSFFSPTFAEHLKSSSRRDPRIHTAHIPLTLTSPTRSQSFPQNVSAFLPPPLAAPFAPKRRIQTFNRENRRASEVPGANILPIMPAELQILLRQRDILVIDIRAFASFAKSRLVGAINVCIPTVLLKRPSLSLDDISDSILSKGDRGRFVKWKEVDGIVIYDVDSLRVKDSYPLATLATKFVEEGFEGTTYGLTGIYLSVDASDDKSPLSMKSPPSSPSTSTYLPQPRSTRLTNVDATTRLALECKESSLFKPNGRSPAAGSSAFFSTIRQNMDLHGGVGPLIPINAPPLPPNAHIPKWLLETAYSPSGPQIVAQRWEHIELAEKERLSDILTDKGMQSKFSIAAALEQGAKNRYSNIWPFEWNRIKVPMADGEDAYFNGSLIGGNGRRYIATQAPLPSTFEDFWRVIWGQGVQVIVCLTAVEERGHIKCHPYWELSTVGSMHITLMHEEQLSLGEEQNAIVRTLLLRNQAEPFAPMREIIQLYYDGWPDFGTPVEAMCIASLIKILNDVISSRGSGKNGPVVVHCSAGCGRTGTFCTVDTVIRYLDSGNDSGDEDIIYRNVLEMRKQRMSMVQTLRQYVLCYESVLYYLLNKASG